MTLASSLAEIDDLFTEKSDKDDGDSIKDKISDKEEEVAQIFANTVAVALAQIEELVKDEFESVEQAEQFVRTMFTLMRSRYRTQLVKSLRRFERLGGKTTASIFRRSL